jgi:hypothetical protein
MTVQMHTPAYPMATPGPYVAEQTDRPRGAWIKGANGNWIALGCGETDREAADNTRLIVAACTAHATLVAALDYVLVNTFLDEHGDPRFKADYDPATVVQALLAAGVTFK